MQAGAGMFETFPAPARSFVKQNLELFHMMQSVAKKIFSLASKPSVYNLIKFFLNIFFHPETSTIVAPLFPPSNRHPVVFNDGPTGNKKIAFVDDSHELRSREEQKKNQKSFHSVASTIDRLTTHPLL